MTTTTTFIARDVATKMAQTQQHAVRDYLDCVTELEWCELTPREKRETELKMARIDVDWLDDVTRRVAYALAREIRNL